MGQFSPSCIRIFFLVHIVAWPGSIEVDQLNMYLSLCVHSESNTNMKVYFSLKNKSNLIILTLKGGRNEKIICLTFSVRERHNITWWFRA